MINTCYSSGMLFGVIFGGIGILQLVLAVFISLTRPIFMIQGLLFTFVGILASVMWARDHLAACVLPVSPQEFVRAKFLLIAGTLTVFFILSAGMLFFFIAADTPIRNAYSVLLLPASLFPITTAFMLFLLATSLSGNMILILIVWVVICGAPGAISGIFGRHIEKALIHTIEAGTAYIGNIPVFLAGLYLGSLVIIALCYKLGIRNFMRMQFSRWMRVDSKK